MHWQGVSYSNAEKPTHRRLATLSEAVEDTVLRGMVVVTDFRRRAIDEGDACAAALTKLQIYQQRPLNSR